MGIPYRQRWNRRRWKSHLLLDEQALRLFQEASQGEIQEAATGDWILDDALRMMRETGPVSSKLAASSGFDRLDSLLPEENELKTATSNDELNAVEVAEQLLDP